MMFEDQKLVKMITAGAGCVTENLIMNSERILS